MMDVVERRYEEDREGGRSRPQGHRGRHPVRHLRGVPDRSDPSEYRQSAARSVASWWEW